MSCSFYRWNGGFFGDYWCDKKNEKVNEDIYSRYCRGYSYDECPIYKQSDVSSGCFLTTVVCNILNKDDQDPVLETMRGFRDEVLQNNEQYFELLKEYDSIGPLLAYKLDHDRQRVEVSKALYSNVLMTVSSYIKEKDYIHAVKWYKSMILFFVDYYGFMDVYKTYKSSADQDEFFDPRTAGHGYIKKI